jgi:hypothetical protein
MIPPLPLPAVRLDDNGDVLVPPASTAAEQRRRLVARVVFVLLTALYGTVTGTVLTTLRCSPASVTVREYARLDIDGSALRARGWMDDLALLQACDDYPYQPACNAVRTILDQRLAVSLLTVNPNAVCWESAHRMAASLAVILLVVYVVAFPLALAWLLPTRLRVQLEAAGLWDAWRAERERDAAARRAWVAAGSGARWVAASLCWPRFRAHDPATALLSPRRSGAKLPASTDAASPSSDALSASGTHAPSGAGSGSQADDRYAAAVPGGANAPIEVDLAGASPSARQPLSADGSTPRAAGASLKLCMDVFPFAFPDTLLLPPALGEYRPSQLSFHAKGALVLLAVTAIQVGVGEPDTVGAAVGRTVAVVAVLVATLAHMAVVWPHKREEGMNAYIAHYSYLLAAVQALLNLAGSIVVINNRLNDSQRAATDAFLALSYVATIAALGLFVLVVAAFAEALSTLHAVAVTARRGDDEATAASVPRADTAAAAAAPAVASCDRGDGRRDAAEGDLSLAAPAAWKERDAVVLVDTPAE